ncbi:Pol protein [Phytophthora palmivora]|uniref:Pol protein n=1 Tax=Phytophthora palmivora TaxID=4796 RepID=A0A2P4XUA4_9STRA|nr:Pol protein [Phytophthora palmivora]
MSLDFVFGLPADDKGNTGMLLFVCRFCKIMYLAPVRGKVTGEQAAQLFLDSVFRYHGLSETIVSDRDSRITGAFWDTLFQLLGTTLTMSTADHPQTDGQTKRVNRVLEDILRSICAETPRSWSDELSMVEFTLNNAVHPSTGFTPFYLNGLTLISRVRDAMVLAQDKQKEYSDTKNTKNLPLKVVSSVESNKVKHRFIGPFAVLARHGAAYTIDLPKSMATHPTFYVRRLKRYHDPLDLPSWTEEDQGENSPPRNETEFSGQPELPVSKPVTETQAGTHAIHTKGMTSVYAPTEFLQGSSRSSAVNAPMERVGLSTKSVQISTKDLKGPWLASLRGSMTTWTKLKGYLDLEADGPRRLTGTPQSPDSKLRVQKDTAEREPPTQTRARAPPTLLDRNG